MNLHRASISARIYPRANEAVYWEKLMRASQHHVIGDGVKVRLVGPVRAIFAGIATSLGGVAINYFSRYRIQHRLQQYQLPAPHNWTKQWSIIDSPILDVTEYLILIGLFLLVAGVIWASFVWAKYRN
jgi:hypothetical protein